MRSVGLRLEVLGVVHQGQPCEVRDLTDFRWGRVILERQVQLEDWHRSWCLDMAFQFQGTNLCASRAQSTRITNARWFGPPNTWHVGTLLIDGESYWVCLLKGGGICRSVPTYIDSPQVSRNPLMITCCRT